MTKDQRFQAAADMARAAAAEAIAPRWDLGDLFAGFDDPAIEATLRSAAGEAKAVAEAHAGRYRYGVSGSLVAYVDATWSRAAVVDLLAVRSPDEVLARLGVDEATLLEGWRAWVTR